MPDRDTQHAPDAYIAAHKAVDAIVLKREHPASMPSDWAALAKEAHAAIDHALKMAAPDLLAALESAPERFLDKPLPKAERDFQEDRYRKWFFGVRAAALAKVKS